MTVIRWLLVIAVFDNNCIIMACISVPLDFWQGKADGDATVWKSKLLKTIGHVISVPVHLQWRISTENVSRSYSWLWIDSWTFTLINLNNVFFSCTVEGGKRFQSFSSFPCGRVKRSENDRVDAIEHFHVTSLAPCWRAKTIHFLSALGNKIYFHAKLFHCFSPPTWPPWKPSILSLRFQWNFENAFVCERGMSVCVGVRACGRAYVRAMLFTSHCPPPVVLNGINNSFFLAIFLIDSSIPPATNYNQQSAFCRGENTFV